MIGRVWRGWTAPASADAYEALLRGRILPAIEGAPGCRGSFLLRRDAGGEVEFVTMVLFESMESIRVFAGEDPERAVVPPDARALLSRFDARSVHYEIRGGAGSAGAPIASMDSVPEAPSDAGPPEG